MTTPTAAPPVELPVELPAELVELARAALAAELAGPDRVGEYLGAAREDDVAVTAMFAARDHGYAGWRWTVTLAVVDDHPPTVSEVTLLPGPAALIAPAWVPWGERVRAGDLGVGDLLLTEPDDIRLVPGYLDSADPDLIELAGEVGLGRVRVMSREGRDDAAERWHDGPFGPADEMARSAPAPCGTCGFYLPLRGSLGGAFGACGNELSPAESRVVDVEFGCGAHSEVVVELARPAGTSVIDELVLEVHTHPELP